jgi:hypothetical protein
MTRYRTRYRTRCRVATGVLAGLLLLSGCGKDGDPSAASSAAGQDKSPLSEYMGSDFTGSGGGGFRIAIGGNDEQPTEEQLAQRRRVEDAIARCMKDQGFRYIPVPPEANQKDRFAEAFRLPPDKFAEQYGYGISTIDFSQAESEDPNTKIRDALSARAKAAYDKALNGQQPQQSNDAGGGAKVVGGGIGGCRAKALDQVYGAGTAAGKGGNKAQEMRRFEGLFQDLEALRKRIQDDPRVAEAARAWSDCMADARQTGLTKPDDAREKVVQKFNQLLGVRPGEKKAITIGPDSLRNIDPAKLAEVRRYELAVAKADYDCRQRGYDKTYKDVQYAAEREFIQDHKTILEQFKDATAEGQR